MEQVESLNTTFKFMGEFCWNTRLKSSFNFVNFSKFLKLSLKLKDKRKKMKTNNYGRKEWVYGIAIFNLYKTYKLICFEG